MNKLEIHKSIERAKGLIGERRIKEAFSLLNELNDKTERWGISDELRRMEETYRYMIHYMIEGVEDSHRSELYDNIISRLLEIIDMVERNLLCQFVNNTIYLNLLRNRSHNTDNLKEAFDRYLVANEKVVLSAAVGINDTDITKEKENSLSDIFITIWLIHHLSEKDYSYLQCQLTSETMTFELKCQVISALMMSLLQYYDERKIALLLTTYQSSVDKRIGVRALVSAILTIYYYKETVSTNKHLTNMLAALSDNEAFLSDIKSILFDFIRTRDTDRINKKMKEEVIPEIMKLQPEIMKRFKDTDKEVEIDLGNMEANPEWEDLLNKSGLSGKLKELSEMQMEGGDVFMIAFSNLKNFSFFNSVANWFLPFTEEHSELAELRALNNENLMNIICGDSIMCDSDKYSFALSVAQMPASQRSMMIQQFDAQFEQINQHRQNSLEHSLTSDYKIEASKYIRDIYRFFKLFRRRTEFKDPFRTPLNFVYLPVIGEELAENENLHLIGEFYFNRGYHSDACALFKMIESQDSCDELILQKIGFCHQSLKEYDKALEYYKKAEILNPDNSWLIKKIAVCHKNLMQYDEAASYYERAIEKNSSNLNLVMNLGHCYLQSGNIPEALKCYYKVEYLDEKSTRALRPIAWCEFELGQYQQSKKYYDRILNDAPTAQDFMNAGHLQLAVRNHKEAVALYSRSIAHSSKDEFIKSFTEDFKHLTQAGINRDDLPIIIDKLLYDND